MEKIKRALEAALDCLAHHSEWCGNKPGANGHPSINEAPKLIHAALSALEGSQPKELTDEEIEQWWGNTHRTMGHLPRTDFEVVAILRSFAGSLPPKEQEVKPVPSALIHERSKPSLMVGFSEEEIERIAAKLHPALGGQWSDDAKAKQLTKRSYAAEAIRYAQEHSQAVSIDTIMEVVMGWCCATKDAEEDLRERLEKLTQQQAQ